MANPLATTLGGANNTARLKQMHPEATSLSIDYYLISKPLSALLNCVDPEVTTSEQYKSKAKALLQQLKWFVNEFEKTAS